jgi:hypothetical protein
VTGVDLVDVVDETFLAVPPEEVAAEFAGPARWRLLWPDLDLTVLDDRGVQGVRWRVGGAWTGHMEVWLESVLDGTVLHYFLRIEPTHPTGPTGPAGRRAATREGVRRHRAAKAIAFALKDRLEAGRPPGVAPAPVEGVRPAAEVAQRDHG